MQTRIPWIDSSRAIAILFVVVAHHSIGADSAKYIFSFHVPLFFFISGLLFQPERNPSFGPYLAKKARTLLVPYFVFTFTLYLFWVVIGSHFGEDSKLPHDFLKPLIGIAYANPTFDGHIGPLWFLPCLFLTETLCWVIHKVAKNSFLFVTALFIVLLAAGIGSTYFRDSIRWCPWNAHVALTGIALLGIGFLSKNIINSWFGKITWRNSFLLLPFLLGNIALAGINGRVDMASNTFGNYPLFYPAALTGIIFYLGVSKLISNRLLQFIGRNTIVILAFHSIIDSLMMGFQSMVLKIPLTILDNSLTAGLLYSFVQMAILIPIIVAINRYFPYVLGKQKRRDERQANFLVQTGNSQ